MPLYPVMQFADDPAMREKLRAPFPKALILKLPESRDKQTGELKRPALDYVSHAAVTDRLNAVAPDWTYTIDELFSVEGTVWIRGTMTIGGVSRPEYGDGKDPKEAVGNFLRRAAMRFGVALDLWAKEDLQASPTTVGEGEAPAGTGGEAAAGSVSGSAPPPLSPPTFESMTLEELAGYAGSIGLSRPKALALAKGMKLELNADGWRQVLTKYQRESV